MPAPADHRIIIGPWRWNPRLQIVAHGPTTYVVDCTLLSDLYIEMDNGDAGTDARAQVERATLIGAVAARSGVADAEVGQFVRLLREVFPCG